MANKIVEDPRIDPRIKDLFKDMPQMAGARVESRDHLLSAMQAMAGQSSIGSLFESLDLEGIAPSAGLTITKHELVSAPDGNTISVNLIRPEGSEALPCVYYIHGGGMMMMSAYDANYAAWGRLIARQGVAVAMVEFRNSAVRQHAWRSCALSRRPQRLPVRSALGARQCGEPRHRSFTRYCCWRERRRKSDAGYGPRVEPGG